MLILINVVALERIRELIPQSLKENRLHFHTWFKLVLNQKLFNIVAVINFHYQLRIIFIYSVTQHHV